VEGFRQLLNVECDTAIVVANLMGVCGFVIIMCIAIIIIKRRYTLYTSAVQPTARELHVARGQILCGPRRTTKKYKNYSQRWV